MVQYQVENGGLGIDEMLKVLMAKTWNATRAKGLQGLILQQNQQLLLGYFLSVAVSDEASFATKAAIMEAIDSIKDQATKNVKSGLATNKGYLLLTLERINKRYEVKPFVSPKLPPGSPIGCDID
jgi:hypothetical protein